MRQEGEQRAPSHPAKAAGWRGAAKGTELKRPGESEATLSGAGAGWAGALATPAHGLGAGRNASGNFFARRLFAEPILGLSPMEQGSLALFRLALVSLVLFRFVRLGSGGVLVVTVKGPDGARGSRNRTECAES